MRSRMLVGLGVIGVTSALVGLVPTAAVAKGATPVTYYAYEEIGPNSLLADRADGVEFMEPTCTPSFEACQIYEFFDRWDVALTGTEVAGSTNILGTLDAHGFDDFAKQSVKGTLALALTSTATTWSGTFSGTFRGPKAGTGTFALAGSDGSKMSGAVLFIGDGLMELTGQVK